MEDLRIIYSVAYIIVFLVVWMFLEKRLTFLHHTNIGKVPAEDTKALNILHFRLKMFVRILGLLLLSGGIFIVITLL